MNLVPLLITEQSWQQIEAGVAQRAELLNRVLADVYGPQPWLTQGLLPAALVQGHSGYLRPLHGAQPAQGQFLHIAAFDLARCPDGLWWVVSQRTQAPSGLGYLLENRRAIARLFPQAFDQQHVQRLGSTYRALVDGMRRLSPGGAGAHLALLTPGPYNETYFEHAYLARYLGLTLVEGSDLLVRNQRVYLKTLRGLEPIHGLLKRLDDPFLDPLELRADSTLGVPGLLQAVRAGNVLLANMPGSGFLESPALPGFLPALAEHLLDEPLKLPALPTWWCGEAAAMEQALPRLAECVIKPTWPEADTGLDGAVLARRLSPAQREAWRQRIRATPQAYTLQAYRPLSQMPVWQDAAQAQGEPGELLARSVLLRVFAVADGAGGWRVLPGGLARVAGSEAEIATMQRGGSSADVWVLGQPGPATPAYEPPQPLPTPAWAWRRRMVTSRAAENLFWLGRYTERAENTARLARLSLECLHGPDPSHPPLLAWLGRLAVRNALVAPGTPDPGQDLAAFEAALVAALPDASAHTSVAYNLRALRLAGAAVRERLSPEHWSLLQQAEQDFAPQALGSADQAGASLLGVLAALRQTSRNLAGITGAQTDRMTRDDGWRLLSIGRHIERLNFLSYALAQGVNNGLLQDRGGFDAMLNLFDSVITFSAQFQQQRSLPPLLELLVLDRDNPRSLAWVVQTLRSRLAKLEASNQGGLGDTVLPDPGQWHLERLCRHDTAGRYGELAELLERCQATALHTSDALSACYFTHTLDAGLRQSA